MQTQNPSSAVSAQAGARLSVWAGNDARGGCKVPCSQLGGCPGVRWGDALGSVGGCPGVRWGHALESVGGVPWGQRGGCPGVSWGDALGSVGGCPGVSRETCGYMSCNWLSLAVSAPGPSAQDRVALSMSPELVASCTEVSLLSLLLYPKL